MITFWWKIRLNVSCHHRWNVLRRMSNLHLNGCFLKSSFRSKLNGCYLKNRFRWKMNVHWKKSVRFLMNSLRWNVRKSWNGMLKPFWQELSSACKQFRCYGRIWTLKVCRCLLRFW